MQEKIMTKTMQEKIMTIRSVGLVRYLIQTLITVVPAAELENHTLRFKV